MPLRIWTGSKEFETTHERRALSRLVREMVTRFKAEVDPYALFIDFSVLASKVDLVALTSRAIVVIDLKEVGRPGGLVHGTENGKWYVDFSDGSRQEINVGRVNPYEQVDGYRRKMINWLDANGDKVFGPQRKAQLELDHVDAWVAVAPSIDEAATRRDLGYLPSSVLQWFNVIGLDHLCQELHDTVTRGMELYDDEIERIARCLGLYEKIHLFDMLVPDELEIPQPRIFSRPQIQRFHLDRDDILDKLLAAMESPECSVIGIGGPGGVGKTHMAGILADLVAEKYKVYWVYCGDHPEITLETLLLAFANELPNMRQAQYVADPDEPVRARIEVVIDYLERERVCLVLDDYHVLDPESGVEKLIQRIDAGCPHVKVVLTTRRRPEFRQDVLVPVKGYREVDLLGLPVGSIVPYLDHQAGGSCLRVSEQDAPVIWERTGGGVPKVLDMLTRVSRGRSPAEVAANIGVYTDAEEAGWFQSLLELVSKDARRLADGSSVVRGALSMGLMAALCDKVDAVACANELVDTFVLFWDEDTGLFSLNDLLRGYLYDRLNPTTRKRYHEKAAQWLARDAEARVPGYERIAALREVVHHAQAAERWDLVLSRAEPVVEYLCSRGEWPKARSVCEEALAAAEKLGKDDQVGRWLLETARQLRHAGKMDESAAVCQRGLAIAERLDAKAMLARAYHELGMWNYRQRNLEESETWHRRALELDRALGERTHLAASLGKLGDIARQRRRDEEALAYYEESAQISEQVGDSAALSITYTQLGLRQKYTGDLARARGYFEQALTHAERTQRPMSMAIALGQLAEVSGRMGDHDRALELIERSLAVRRDVLDTPSNRIGLGIRIDIMLAAGRLEGLETYLGDLEAATPEDDALGRAFNLKRRGLQAIWQGSAESGTEQVRKAAAFFQEKGYMDYAQDCEQAIGATLDAVKARKE